MFQVHADDAASELAKRVVEENPAKLFDEVQAAIAKSQEACSGAPIVDRPGEDFPRKATVSDVCKSLSRHWDAIRGGRRALFVFRRSRAHGIRTLDLPRAGVVEFKHRPRKRVCFDTTELILCRMSTRLAVTIARLCRVIRGLRSAIDEARREASVLEAHRHSCFGSKMRPPLKWLP